MHSMLRALAYINIAEYILFVLRSNKNTMVRSMYVMSCSINSGPSLSTNKRPPSPLPSILPIYAPCMIIVCDV